MGQPAARAGRGQRRPPPVERDFALGPDGAPASNASTDDAQAIVGLNTGSVPARPPDTAAKVRITPGDAGTLGPLPPGLRAVSNAYRVEMSYAPSGTPLDRLAVKGTIALTAADVGDRLLYSPDGQAWQELTFRPYGQDHGMFTELDTLGWFLVASSAQPSGEGSDGPRTLLLVLAGVAPVVGAILVVRLPSPVPAAPARRPAARPRTGAKKGGRKKPKRRR